MTLQVNPAVAQSVMCIRWPYYTSLEFHKIKCRNQTSETIKDCSSSELRA